MKRILHALTLLALLCTRSIGAEQKSPPDSAQQSRHPRYESEYLRRTFKGAGDAELSYG